MTTPPASTYLATQVATASPAERVVLLYLGAIRHGVAHLAALERGQVEAAHRSSIRAQEIVAALRGSLDHSAGPIADQLEQLYAFVLDRLMAGNMTKTPRPTQDALDVLRGLLPAWQTVAIQATAGTTAAAADATAPRSWTGTPAARPAAQTPGQGRGAALAAPSTR